MCCLEWFVHGLVSMKEVCKGDRSQTIKIKKNKKIKKGKIAIG